jgi:large subunit ribosomal protein L24
LRASLHGKAQQDSVETAAKGIAALADGDLRLEAQMDGDDGAALIALLGLDKTVAVASGPGFVNAVISGPLAGALHVDGRILAGGLDAKASGAVRITGDQAPSADLRLAVSKADVRPLLAGAGAGPALPLTLQARVALSERSVALSDVTASLAGAELRGALTVGLGPDRSIAGHIDADSIDAAAVIATAIGAPATAPRTRGGASAGWSADPYGSGRFAELEGRIALTVMNAALTPSLSARQLRAMLVFHGPEITLDDLDAHVAGGRMAGHVVLRRRNDGLGLRAAVELTRIDAAAVLPGEARPAIGGRLSAKLDVQANGLSPKALIGSLAGTGTMLLEDGYFSSLNPSVFDTVVRASDQGIAVGATNIRDIVTASLNSGRLTIPRIETTVTINAGQVRPANTVAEANGAELVVSGSFDLIQSQMDVRLTLSGPARTDGSAGRPEIFVGLKGPIAAPQRTVDVTALAGWLTIRRIDQQAKKLEALEAAARAQEAERSRARMNAPTPAVPPPAPAPLAPAQNEVVPAAPPARPSVAKPAVTKPSVAKPSTLDPAPPPAAAAAPQREAPQIATPEPTASAAVSPAPAAAVAHPAPQSAVAPPLPAPLDIRTVPRGPKSGQGSALDGSAHEPLRLPSAPSVLDSIIGSRR